MWDGLIEKNATEKSRDCATKFQVGITKIKATHWMTGNETRWAFESYLIGKTIVYQGYSPGPQDLTGTNLGDDYFKQMRPIVEEQLRKAGVRLAKVLEQSLGG